MLKPNLAISTDQKYMAVATFVLCYINNLGGLRNGVIRRMSRLSKVLQAFDGTTLTNIPSWVQADSAMAYEVCSDLFKHTSDIPSAPEGNVVSLDLDKEGAANTIALMQFIARERSTPMLEMCEAILRKIASYDADTHKFFSSNLQPACEEDCIILDYIRENVIFNGYMLNTISKLTQSNQPL